jgi:hypothetical protein
VLTSLVATFLLFQHRWTQVTAADPRKVLAQEIADTLRARLKQPAPHIEEVE